jgi:hypothetical protein
MSGISRTKCPFIPGLTVRFKQDRVSVYLRTGCPKSQEYAGCTRGLIHSFTNHSFAQ